VASAFLQDEIALQESLHLIAAANSSITAIPVLKFSPTCACAGKSTRSKPPGRRCPRRAYAFRTDADGQVVASIVTPGATTFVTRLQNNPAALSESVLSYEAGYRSQLSEQVQVDVAVFYSKHRDLMTIEREANFVEGAYTVIPLVFRNRASATSHGLEWSGSWRPTDKWQFKHPGRGLK